MTITYINILSKCPTSEQRQLDMCLHPFTITSSHVSQWLNWVRDRSSPDSSSCIRRWICWSLDSLENRDVGAQIGEPELDNRHGDLILLLCQVHLLHSLAPCPVLTQAWPLQGLEQWINQWELCISLPLNNKITFKIMRKQWYFPLFYSIK